MNVSTRVREGVLIVDLQGSWPRQQEGWGLLQTNVMEVLSPWSGKFALKIWHDELAIKDLLNTLIRIRKETHHADDERLVVITSSAKLRYVFELTRLTSLFDVVATEEEALGLPPAAAPMWKPSASAILLIVAGVLVLIGLIRACKS